MSRPKGPVGSRLVKRTIAMIATIIWATTVTTADQTTRLDAMELVPNIGMIAKAHKRLTITRPRYSGGLAVCVKSTSTAPTREHVSLVNSGSRGKGRTAQIYGAQKGTVGRQKDSEPK